MLVMSKKADVLGQKCTDLYSIRPSHPRSARVDAYARALHVILSNEKSLYELIANNTKPSRHPGLLMTLCVIHCVMLCVIHFVQANVGETLMLTKPTR